ncbi:SnoaL-like polyketide cyclase [Saccharothrix sp. ALI-22-I]|uniref:nuclear transport factor 2 family protein n=1 Tax=Saccharothrix sp. ALI-22-I TaxID=1933778 RepID=UPI00097BEEE2|nr:nuclear transport factor 2 family protein [Saccharothrix sp. ALI-22-I]ONI87703.1 SnoaL-like polyketide cyclase [Saccharothrix sp. ALI-22-I]
MRKATPLPRKAVTALLVASTIGAVTGLAPLAASASAPDSTATGSWQKGLYAFDFGLEVNKAITVHVLKRLFEDSDLSVVDRHIRPDYIQHNPLAPNGTEALKAFAGPLATQFPDLKYDIKRVVAEGDLVLVHSNVVFTPGARGSAVVDIFRFDRNHMIAEHWDAAQDVPATTVSGNDMFSTVSSPQTNRPGPRHQTESSKAVATEYFDRLLVRKDPGAVEYLAPEYHQHNPAIPSGSAGLREQFTAFFQAFPQLTVERKRVIAEGDLVAVHAHYRLTPSDRGQSVVDIFRVGKDGKIVEHWDVVQDVPATSANDNTMF